jgi:cytochrome c oxidase cbb3-type subunit 3
MTPPAIAQAVDHSTIPVTETKAAVEGSNTQTTAADDARLMDHAYDGIREYDNPLPGWWRALFWLSIVFAAGYWVWFHVGPWGKTPQAKYEVALAQYADDKGRREKAELRDISEDTFARNASDPKLLDHGMAIFAARCASCHAAEGQGLIGPNLTDGYQMHGASRMDIFKTIRTGVPGTAMLAWGEQMPPADVAAVTTFVATLRGKNVQGKEPQGAPVEAFK